MYKDRRYQKVELYGIRVETEKSYSVMEEYTEERLYCKSCNSELTKAFENSGPKISYIVEPNPNESYEMNYCPHCGKDLRKE